MDYFNINTLHNKHSNHSNTFSNKLASKKYFKLINKTTRETSLLDNIYTNYTCTSGIIQTDFSDYYTIFCYINEIYVKLINRLIMKRSYSEKTLPNSLRHCDA